MNVTWMLSHVICRNFGEPTEEKNAFNKPLLTEQIETDIHADTCSRS